MTTALERDLEACESATEGPWETKARGIHPHRDYDIYSEATDADIAIEVYPSDADFIAQARIRWPAALRVVKAVMEMRSRYGDRCLSDEAHDALRAFEEE
jgi:hypothetical protein